MADVDSAAGIGDDSGNDAIGLNLLRRDRSERDTILRTGYLDNVVAHVSQSAAGGALGNFVDGLVECASYLRVTKSRDPRAIHAGGICGVAGAEPGAALVRTDAIADVGEALQVGEVEAGLLVRGPGGACGALEVLSQVLPSSELTLLLTSVRPCRSAK